MNPKISLLVLTYKNPEGLIKLLQSVVDTIDYDNYEWVIRDNSIANTGVPRGMNELFARANGDIFVLLNDDFYFTDKGWLQVMMKELDEKTIVSDRVFTFRFGEACSVCPVMFYKEVIDFVGGLDERFIGYGSDDLDWCIRARILGYKFKEVQIKSKHEGSKASGKIFGSKIDKLKIINNEILNKKWGGLEGEIATI